MNIITLRIASVERRRISMTLMSLDPNRRIPTPAFETENREDLGDLLKGAAVDFRAALRSSDRPRLGLLGRRYADLFLPKALLPLLSSRSERFLYLDIDEDLVGFPWEMLILQDDTTIGRRFFVGRHQRLAEQRMNENPFILKNPLLVTDPEGTMDSAASEGMNLKNLFSKYKIASTLLSSSVSVDDVLSRLEGASLLHYSGHSSADALMLADGPLGAAQIEASRGSPFFAFLNSCSPAAPEGWEQTAYNLTKSLQKAGSYVVISPITLVDGENAAKFAEIFYEYFLQGDAVGEAFYKAGNAIDPSGLFPANYVLYGNPLFRARTGPRGFWNKRLAIAGSVLGLAVLLALLLIPRPKVLDTGKLAETSSQKLVVPEPLPPVTSALLKMWQDRKRGQGTARNHQEGGDPQKLSGSEGFAYASLLYKKAGSIEELEAAIPVYERAANLGSVAARADHQALQAYTARERKIRDLQGHLAEVLNPDDKEAARVLAARLGGPCPNTTYSVLARDRPSSDLAIQADTCALFPPHQLDEALGFAWYKKIAELDTVPVDAQALVKLGQAYETGNGVAQNYQEAFRAYRKAADAGDPYACSRLAFFFQYGMGVANDLAQALHWREKAVEVSASKPALQAGYKEQLEEFKEELFQR